jgi:hypothetical protein
MLSTQSSYSMAGWAAGWACLEELGASLGKESFHGVTHEIPCVHVCGPGVPGF